MDKETFIQQANAYGSSNVPFFFLFDFELRKPFICKKEEAGDAGFFYNIKGQTNFTQSETPSTIPKLNPVPVAEKRYAQAFKTVKENLLKGNTYLLNLTFPTPLDNKINLRDIFANSPAPYKLFHKDNFVLFSPESFVRIENNTIYSYPMKGTIDAAIEDAQKKILEDRKEHWEHNTIVDLIRNDLSIVSENVKVTKFRYLDRLKTSHKELLQVSSEIRGDLPEDWRSHIGEILWKLLPAGSISGAPKAKTVDIIRKSEGQERGFFTGVFGLFDGNNLDSAVNIRFIEKTKTGYQFRSGGGITALSNMKDEYQEMINKVYVPVT